MLRRLHKLAGTSAQLRQLSINKTAGFGSVVTAPLRAAGRVAGGWAKNNKLTAGAIGLGAVAAPFAVRGSYVKNKSGFDPAISSLKMGLPPPQ